MSVPLPVVLGIDVGGRRKGFHAASLWEGKFETAHFGSAEELASWCEVRTPGAIAVDAPCGWARTGASRLAERTLALGGQRIRCFGTPRRSAARGRAFYDWVFHGEGLYRVLRRQARLYDGRRDGGPVLFETFPHGVACALAGCVLPARGKADTRRALLARAGCDISPLTNLDLVDAALCAVAARAFLAGNIVVFGDRAEGFILLPSPGQSPVGGRP